MSSQSSTARDVASLEQALRRRDRLLREILERVIEEYDGGFEDERPSAPVDMAGFVPQIRLVLGDCP